MKKQYSSIRKLPLSEPKDASAGVNSTHRLAPEDVAFAVTSDEIDAVDDGGSSFHVIGQPRAQRALRMALEMRGKEIGRAHV